MSRGDASRTMGYQSGAGKRRATGTVRSLLFVVALIAVLVKGRAQGPAADFPPIPDATRKESDVASKSLARSNTLDYVISPEDVLDIYVFEVPEISRAYRVSPTGFITLPLMSEPIAAAGLSLGQLSQLIAAKFREAGVLNSPQVMVSVKETRLHSVVIGGAVKNPQIYPIFGTTKLLDLLSQAGGLSEEAGSMAIIRRGEIAMQVAGGEGGKAGPDPERSLSRTVSVDLRKLVEIGDESWNLVLYPGDRVTVQRAPIIYVIGAVGRPGGYPLKDPQEEMTVLKVLALAGDVTAWAKRRKLVILRKNSQVSGGREEVALDLKKILAGLSPDPKLQSDDILFVPESGRTKAIRQVVGTGIGAGTAITTGLIIYRR